MTCGECRHYSVLPFDFMGKCGAPYPKLIMPYSMRHNQVLSRMPVMPDEGEGCVSFAPRPEATPLDTTGPQA